MAPPRGGSSVKIPDRFGAPTRAAEAALRKAAETAAAEVQKARKDPEKVMEALAGLHVGASRHILLPQFVEGRVLRQGRPLQRPQILPVQGHVRHNGSGRHQSLPIEQRGGRELPQHRRRDQRPLLQCLATCRTSLIRFFRVT